MTTWQTKTHERLQEHANRLFSEWVKSKAGAKWKARRKSDSPYRHGFGLPEYHHDLIEALGQNNEREAKAIMLRYYL